MRPWIASLVFLISAYALEHVGLPEFTNSWDPNNGQILISTDQGKTFTASKLPFKVGGNMPGRGMGEVSTIAF